MPHNITSAKNIAFSNLVRTSQKTDAHLTQQYTCSNGIICCPEYAVVLSIWLTSFLAASGSNWEAIYLFHVSVILYARLQDDEVTIDFFLWASK